MTRPAECLCFRVEEHADIIKVVVHRDDRANQPLMVFHIRRDGMCVWDAPQGAEISIGHVMLRCFVLVGDSCELLRPDEGVRLMRPEEVR